MDKEILFHSFKDLMTTARDNQLSDLDIEARAHRLSNEFWEMDHGLRIALLAALASYHPRYSHNPRGRNPMVKVPAPAWVVTAKVILGLESSEESTL